MATLLAVGVPDIRPVVLSMVRPGGSVGETLYLSEPVPPPPWIGRSLAGEPWSRKMTGAFWAAVTAVLTVRLNEADAVALVASVTVTVKVVAPKETLGEPLMVPVEESIVSPVGNGGATA